MIAGWTPEEWEQTWPGEDDEEPEIVTRKGKPVSVILPIKDYQELLERAEDAAVHALYERSLTGPEYAEGVAAFLAKRAPDFRGVR